MYLIAISVIREDCKEMEGDKGLSFKNIIWKPIEENTNQMLISG